MGGHNNKAPQGYPGNGLGTLRPKPDLIAGCRGRAVGCAPAFFPCLWTSYAGTSLISCSEKSMLSHNIYGSHVVYVTLSLPASHMWCTWPMAGLEGPERYSYLLANCSTVGKWEAFYEMPFCLLLFLGYLSLYLLYNKHTCSTRLFLVFLAQEHCCLISEVVRGVCWSELLTYKRVN